jgi:hypothetical protein
MNCTWFIISWRDTLVAVNARNDIGFPLHWLEIVVLALVAAAIFQVFLRYQYVSADVANRPRHAASLCDASRQGRMHRSITGAARARA